MATIYQMPLAGKPILMMIRTARYLHNTKGKKQGDKWMDEHVPDQLRKQVESLI